MASCTCLHVGGLSIDESQKEKLVQLTEARWNDAHSRMHAADAAGYALDPEYCSHDYTSNEEVCLSWLAHCLNISNHAMLMFQA